MVELLKLLRRDIDVVRPLDSHVTVLISVAAAVSSNRRAIAPHQLALQLLGEIRQDLNQVRSPLLVLFGSCVIFLPL